mgnify:CR=1 FL=1
MIKSPALVSAQKRDAPRACARLLAEADRGSTRVTTFEEGLFRLIFLILKK